ncbi:hypothetical protein [Desulfoplanes formicivorans]|uniref:Uncharacterized protein n=1 Tax=Desulfoplanes formicivorans TaxID=1592317 RepID=A0A194AJW2_9BACT|nr:hypothetical protein [Desulfoplanes formicivorans]GAU09530.1 hypothetical protein DPF_2257 [Desulfoplanes formicivorans]
MSKDRLMIHFPLMHPQLLPDSLPDAIRLMDPGCVEQGEGETARYFRSGDLVYEDRLARQFLQDSLEFGEQFKQASDAAYFRAGSMENFFSGSMQEIKSELLSPPKDGAEELKKKMTDAQLLLLLGFHLEEQMLELGALQHKINTSVRDFEENLGMSEDDQCGFGANFSSHGPGTLAHMSMDWRRLVIPFLWFVPGQAGLVVSDLLILTSLEDKGLKRTPVSREDLVEVFPDWNPHVPVTCSMDNISGGELADLTGVKVPGELANKEIMLVGCLV